MFQKDYVMRIIEQAVQALARMTGLLSDDKPKEALRAADSIYDLLGIPRQLVDIASSATVAQLCSHPEKMRILAKTLISEADAYAAQRDPLTAVKKRRMAMELYLEAHALDPQPDDEDVITELGRRVPSSSLDARFKLR